MHGSCALTDVANWAAFLVSGSFEYLDGLDLVASKFLPLTSLLFYLSLLIVISMRSMNQLFLNNRNWAYFDFKKFGTHSDPVGLHEQPPKDRRKIRDRYRTIWSTCSREERSRLQS